MNYTNNRQSPPAFISSQMYYTGSREFRPRQPDINVDAPINTNFFNLMMGRCTLNDIIMEEFKNNGIDSPYEPQEELGVHKAAEIKPRPVESGLSQEQLHVLCSLPSYCVYQILKGLEANGVYSRRRVQAIMECRFCKNNNEQEAYYRSHILKDSTGRVVCPVLRDFVCRCCGASGDNAHTIKYCPQSSDEDRMVSCAMLRTSRMSSGRRRGNPRTHSLPSPPPHHALPSAPQRPHSPPQPPARTAPLSTLTGQLWRKN